MRTRFGKRGVTLLELMVVVGIIGIVAGIAIPNYIKWLPHLRLKGAVRDVSNTLQMARIKAVTKNRTYAVVVDFADDSFQMGEWNGGSLVSAEQDSSTLGWIGIDLVDTAPSAPHSKINDGGSSGRVAFKSDGTASVDNTTTNLQGQGAIFLKNNPLNNEYFMVVIDEVSGKIKIQTLVGTSWVE